MLAAEVRCARSNGFPVVMLHATPDNEDGCEFSRFFGDKPRHHPTCHARTSLWPSTFTSGAACICTTLRLVPCTVPHVRLRACAPSAETTPQELIADGLYKALALAWYTDPFRQVSSEQVVSGKWCE